MTRFRSVLPLIILIIIICFKPVLVVKASPAIIYSDPSDGVVTGSGSINEINPSFWVGDEQDPPNTSLQALVKFSLSGISGTLESARLNIFLDHSNLDTDINDNTSPLDNIGLGDCLIRHIDDYGTLDAADFDASSIGNDPGVLIGSAETPDRGYISIDVRAAMQDDINNGRLFTAFLIRMSIDTDDDALADRWFFYSSDMAGTDFDPYIEYSLAPPDFQMDASPDSLIVNQGGSQNSNITVTSLNSFSSSVELSYSWFGSVPSGITVDLPSPVTPPAGGVGNSTLTVSASSTASTGSFTLRVTGVDDTLTHQKDIAVNITGSPSPSPSPPPTSACIIVTATYNSPSAPEVAYARHVRDDLIGSTKTGRILVLGWNSFYYSWSPAVANLIGKLDVLKFTFKILLQPLLAIIYVAAQVYNILIWLNPDLASITAFTSAAIFSVAVYLVTPYLVIKITIKYVKKIKASMCTLAFQRIKTLA